MAFDELSIHDLLKTLQLVRSPVVARITTSNQLGRLVNNHGGGHL